MIADRFNLGADGAPHEELADIQLEILSLRVEHRGYEQLHSSVQDGPVLGEVFALEVGVDRHLGITASANCRDEVDRGLTAALDKLRFGFGCQNYFHMAMMPHRQGKSVI